MKMLITIIASALIVGLAVWAIKTKPAHASPTVERRVPGPAECYGQDPISGQVWGDNNCSSTL